MKKNNFFDFASLDGYGTEPEEEVQEQDLEEEEVENEEPILLQVESRLAKANCYRVLLENEMFTDATEVAEEVEEEVRNFVRERLAVLMGIKGETAQSFDFPFTPEEVTALKAVARKILTKPTVPAAPTLQPATLKPAAPKLAPKTVTPAKATSVKAATTTQSTEKRGRGRPKGAKDKVKRAPRSDRIPTAIENVYKEGDKMVFVSPDTGEAHEMHTGTQVRPTGTIQPVPPPRNPSEWAMVTGMQSAQQAQSLVTVETNEKASVVDATQMTSLLVGQLNS